MHFAIIWIPTFVVPHIVQVLHLVLVSPAVRHLCIHLKLTWTWLTSPSHVVRVRLQTRPHTDRRITPPPLIHQYARMTNVIIDIVPSHHLPLVLLDKPSAVIWRARRLNRTRHNITSRVIVSRGDNRIHPPRIFTPTRHSIFHCKKTSFRPGRENQVFFQCKNSNPNENQSKHNL